MTFSAPPPMFRDSVRSESFFCIILLIPPAPERGSIPSWHLASSLRPLAPLPSDLAASLRPRRVTGLRTRAATLTRSARQEALATVATVACALLLGGLFGISVGHALRHRSPATAARPR
jgi:ABC-type nitrate/sulfonate/bicarbonate transport system permease component